MINIETYKDILDEGLTLDHYHVMCAIRDGTPLPKSKRIQGFLNLLHKKGYIEDNSLSAAALLLLGNSVSTTTTSTTTFPENKDQFDFGAWATEVHRKCKEKIKELTGKYQVTDRINRGKSFSFLCNSIDLTKVLYKVITSYNLKDLDAIEKCMINHIVDCHRSGKWFPLMKYYIYKADGPLSKEGESKLVTDLENPDKGNTGGFKSSQKFI